MCIGQYAISCCTFQSMFSLVNKKYRAILFDLVYILIKNVLSFLENNYICLLLKTSWEILPPPPPF